MVHLAEEPYSIFYPLWDLKPSDVEWKVANDPGLIISKGPINLPQGFVRSVR